MPQPRTDQAVFDAKIAAATEMDFARLAAFVDGEGTIMIGRTKMKNKPNMYNFVLTLIVANTDLRLLAWLSRTFSGENLFRGKGNWGNKPCYSWRLFEKRAAVVITRIMPYLICKREQAEIALAYRELRDQGSKGRKLTLVDMEARNELRNKVCALNRPQFLESSQEISNG